jgi:hypothetical protein
VAALIVAEIDARALEQYQKSWLPLLRGEEDATWDWKDFVDREHHEGCEHFSLWVAGNCEGLAIVRRHKPMRSENATGLQGCYVERLCTAPWNRTSVRNRTRCVQPRIRPVGKWLLWRATCLSVELGYSVRMGWHSLEGAKSDYRRVFPELFDLGPDDDDEDRLPWFEIGEAAAKQLIFDKPLIHDMDIQMMWNLRSSDGGFDV